MSLFVIADLHLSFGVDKPMDVFGGRWTNYIDKLDEYWKYMVSDGDTVVIPGDISWAMDFKEAVEDFRFLNSLPGRKIIMKGNHDYWWSGPTKLKAFLDENGFDSIDFLHNNAIEAEDKLLCGSRGWMCDDKMTAADRKVLDREAMRFEMSIADARKKDPDRQKEIVVFSHYPVAGSGYMKNPIMDVLRREGIKRVYYGHLHDVDRKKLIEECDGISLYLTAADYLVFTPMKIS